MGESVRKPYFAAVVPVSASMILPRGDGCVLLIHENCGGRRWRLLGGAVEPTGAPWEAAVWEAREEICVDVSFGPSASCLLRKAPVGAGRSSRARLHRGDRLRPAKRRRSDRHSRDRQAPGATQS